MTSGHRSFPEAADGRPMPPMGHALLEASKGLLDWNGAAELARNLRESEFYLVRSADLGWDDISRFQDALRNGQDVREDGGGFFARCLMALFGKQPDVVETYQQAAERLLREAGLTE